MSSIMDTRIQIDSVKCAVSVVHDKKAQNANCGNVFIVLERMEGDKHTIKKFELVIDKDGAGTVTSKTYANVDKFKQAMRGKDCHACSFGMFSPANVEETLKQPVEPSDMAECRAKINTPSFFNTLRITSFDWARTRTMNAVTDQDVREHVEAEISATIERSLSPSPRCLVM